jgi:peptidoglycan-associated lipoprotein
MTSSLRRTGAKLALAALLAASAAACAHKPPPPPEPPPSAPPAPPPSDMGPPPPPGPVNGAPIPGSVQDFVVSAGDRVYFDLNQDQVSSEGQGVLNNQAQWLSRYPQVMVRIEGNCDERGTREYNLALGARRANAVKAYLVGRGVSPARITTISFGKERPIDPGQGEDAYAHNRNAHTAIVSGAVGGGTSSDFNGAAGPAPGAQ